MQASILVLEDNTEVRQVIVEALRDEGATVVAANNLRTARAMLIESGPFDVLVLDVRLPDGDGRSLCADLRQSGCDTPVILLSGLDHEDDIVDGFSAGADDYLAKPFGLGELVARVGALLRHAAPAAAQGVAA